MDNNTMRRYWGFRPWTRHSMVLFVAGLVYVAIGLAYFNAVYSLERVRALEAVLDVIPFKHWGVVFMICGAAVVVSSRWPRHQDKWGYQVLTGLSAGWGAAYGLSIIFGSSPLTNITAVLLWILTSFLWWAISGLLDPETVIKEVLDESAP